MSQQPSKTPRPTLLIIGAGGFIGGFIAKIGVERGYNVWAGVRETTSTRYLDELPVELVTFDYDNPDQLREALMENAPSDRGWDYIIWNLGATKCANFQDFNRINYLYLRDFCQALINCGMVPKRFLFMSSLSALGPADEKDYTPITSRTIPNPNTRYGLSKIKAETYLETLPDFPWIIFRATGVYGPHEKDYLMMIKSIDRHIDVGMGYRKQLLTFIYVEDLVNAMFDAFKAGVEKKKYIISEPRSYTQKEFRQIVLKHLGGKWALPLKLPMWAVYLASFGAEMWGKARLQPSTLNRDKFKIMKQRNWSCDVSDAQRDFGFNPQFDLDRGIAATVAAYKESKAHH
ncbi:MAG: NAD(P)-dependent oxidoreductase [Bacteroidales bacterium]|nr:NAD(P)-dependent oxidoreductase [Bacteroidales bacterium]